jgi:hypothetical protein
MVLTGVDETIMKTFLKILFSCIFLWMIAMTMHVQAHKSITLSPSEFNWQTSPWACATLFDAYFGFVTFFVWVCFKERSHWARLVWFILILSLGNIAMSGYVLLRLFKLRADEPASAILTRR